MSSGAKKRKSGSGAGSQKLPKLQKQPITCPVTESVVSWFLGPHWNATAVHVLEQIAWSITNFCGRNSSVCPLKVGRECDSGGGVAVLFGEDLQDWGSCSLCFFWDEHMRLLAARRRWWASLATLMNFVHQTQRYLQRQATTHNSKKQHVFCCFGLLTVETPSPQIALGVMFNFTIIPVPVQSLLLQGLSIAHPLHRGLASCGRTKLDTGKISVSAMAENLKIFFSWFKWC